MFAFRVLNDIEVSCASRDKCDDRSLEKPRGTNETPYLIMRNTSFIKRTWKTYVKNYCESDGPLARVDVVRPAL